ncbi:hypothetical protein GCM10025864_39570 [Luteimicrobium album]|uniref:DUF3168 domain-containing protein n=1 Tax=Luteimicrobium album TaxID=1054550 RepID=A0ABQ6I8A9_9MICO|nr:hypothetical protein [Luteimicrobium album]GMA26198.1 hypothetical protein GCM10025864_39570 [Luteimicrobium album]
MSASKPLYDAIKALAPSGITVYSGEAKAIGSAVLTPPWLVLNIETPDSIRSAAATHLAGTGRLKVTVCAADEANCHYWIDAVHEAWRGARVQVPGWAIGTLIQTEQSGPYLAGLTATDTNLRYQVAQVWFSFTASPLT